MTGWGHVDGGSTKISSGSTKFSGCATKFSSDTGLLVFGSTSRQALNVHKSLQDANSYS